MAKDINPLSVRERLLAGLHDKLDKNEDIEVGMADDASYLAEVKRFVPTGIDALDIILSMGKGLPCGRFIEVYGKESSGKTAICQYLIGRYINDIKGTVHYLDYDKSYEQEHMDCYKVSKADIFYPDLITMENGWDYLSASLETLNEIRKDVPDCPPSLILWDSLAASSPKAEMEADSNENHQMGQVSKAAGKGLRTNRRIMSISDATVIFINEIRDVMNARPGQKQTKTPGGWATKFAYSLRLEITLVEHLKNKKGVIVGQRIKITTEKNKHAPKRMECEVMLSYARGIDAGWSNFEFYKDKNFISAAGSKGYKWDGEGEPFSRKEFGAFYAANPEKIAAARAKILADTLKSYEETEQEEKKKRTDDDE